MTTIRELFPRPNISVNEKALRPLIYGFNCMIFNNDEFVNGCVFLDPETFSMINMYFSKSGELFRRISIYDIKNVPAAKPGGDQGARDHPCGPGTREADEAQQRRAVGDRARHRRVRAAEHQRPQAQGERLFGAAHGRRFDGALTLLSVRTGEAGSRRRRSWSSCCTRDICSGARSGGWA